MKLKNVEVGQRVQLISNANRHVGLPEGTTGVALESDSVPFVRWDVAPNELLHDAISDDGINRNYAVMSEEVRVIEE